jgi:hypothetical protein
MNQSAEVVIVMGQCTNRREDFGIRFEQQMPGRWLADWAFAIRDTLAQKEGYYSSEITGAFEFDGKYPGCPYCEASSIYKCGSCGKVACWDGRMTVTCPWCKQTAQISGQIDKLTAGGDR